MMVEIIIKLHNFTCLDFMTSGSENYNGILENFVK